jgi:hypothetical protein
MVSVKPLSTVSEGCPKYHAIESVSLQEVWLVQDVANQCLTRGEVLQSCLILSFVKNSLYMVVGCTRRQIALHADPCLM